MRFRNSILILFSLSFLFISTSVLAQENYIGYRLDRKIFSFLIILAIGLIVFISSAIKSIMLYVKANNAKKLIQGFSRKDVLWNPNKMNERVEEVFFEVQKAWTERNQEIAKNSLSKRMYEDQKSKTDEHLKKGEINILKNIKLTKSTIISARDYSGNSKDTFSSHIKGELFNYTIDEKTGETISGDDAHYKKLEEVWHFIKGNNNWVLDRIDRRANIYNLIDNYIEI